MLLALAAAYELSGDARVREEIDSLVAFLDSGLRSPHGGFIEGIPATLPRRQNPQMHLFEAMLALYEATGEPQFQNRAGDFFGLFVGSLFDQQTQTLGEYFDAEWKPAAGDKGGWTEPGHHFEWASLLVDFADVQAHLAQVGADAVITIDAQNSITLHNVTASQLVAGDFLFV